MEEYAFNKFNNTNGYSKANLSEIVVSYVKNRILAGDLKSGDRLIETDISDELKVSRAPVREAMRELNILGILDFSPRKGSQVLEMTYEDIAEIFSIRIPLEMQVISIIFEKSLLEDKDLEYLERLNNEMINPNHTAMDEKEMVYMLNVNDLTFHSFFWRKSNSLRRANILEGQFFQLLIAMNQDISTLGSIQEKYDQHKAIIDACKTGSVDETLSAFKIHMDSYLNAISNFDK